ncbi:MAG: recombinase family protein [Lachnospiraceae bacterium]|nr:recombinase family protein [Lachnospiraceae bacterium]
MKAVIYARYSKGPRQTEQSIEGQVRDCQAYAKKHGLDIIHIYADHHISGKVRRERCRTPADAQRCRKETI